MSAMKDAAIDQLNALAELNARHHLNEGDITVASETPEAARAECRAAILEIASTLRT